MIKRSFLCLCFCCILVGLVFSCANKGTIVKENNTTSKELSVDLTQSLAKKIEDLLEKSHRDSLGFYILCSTPSAEPLFFVNEVEVSGDSVRSLNPQDIFSFSILADSTAHRLFEQRAAHGVIFIKLKK